MNISDLAGAQQLLHETCIHIMQSNHHNMVNLPAFLYVVDTAGEEWEMD